MTAADQPTTEPSAPMMSGPGHASFCGNEAPHKMHRHPEPDSYEVCSGREAPLETGLRIEHGWLVEETTGCTCAGGTEESAYLHEPRCGLTPLQRLDDLPGWPLAPAPQPAADTETEVQWGVRRPNGTHFKASSRDGADRVIAGRGDGTRVRRVATKTATYTSWEEA